jgi:hypothetical protein
MASVHRLQEIEGFRAAHLADDNSLRAHAQAVSHEIAHRDRPAPLEIRRPRLKPHHMRLLQLQFRCILAGNYPLVGIDVLVMQLRSVVFPDPVPPEINSAPAQ